MRFAYIKSRGRTELIDMAAMSVEQIMAHAVTRPGADHRWFRFGDLVIRSKGSPPYWKKP